MSPDSETDAKEEAGASIVNRTVFERFVQVGGHPVIPRLHPHGIDRRRRNFLRLIGATATLPVFTGTGAAEQVRTIVDYDPPDLPENLAVDSEGNVFMSMATTRQVRKLPAEKTDETGLSKEDTELIETLGGTGTFVTGVAVDDDGTLFAANTNFDDETQSYVWKIVPEEDPTQLASFPEESLVNGVLIDADRDRLLVSDSFQGKVWSVPLDDGDAETWIDDDLLDPPSDPWENPGSVFGANGLAISEGVLHVANLDFGQIVRIPIDGDGNAEEATVFVKDDSLVGADGITFHNGSNLYVSVNAKNAIRRVNPAGKITTVVSGDPLDYPADVAFDTRCQGRLFIANFAFRTARSDQESANPALLQTHP